MSLEQIWQPENLRPYVAHALHEPCPQGENKTLSSVFLSLPHREQVKRSLFVYLWGRASSIRPSLCRVWPSLNLLLSKLLSSEQQLSDWSDSVPSSGQIIFGDSGLLVRLPQVSKSKPLRRLISSSFFWICPLEPYNESCKKISVRFFSLKSLFRTSFSRLLRSRSTLSWALSSLTNELHGEVYNSIDACSHQNFDEGLYLLAKELSG